MHTALQENFWKLPATEIEKFQASIEELNSATIKINNDLAALENQQAQLAATNEKLESRPAERIQALAALNNVIASDNAELEQLEFDQAELQSLLEEIARAMSSIRPFVDVPPLASPQEELTRPVDGSMLSRFGCAYAGGNLMRQDIFIGTAEGSPATAVHPGYVAFASRLQEQRFTHWA